MNAYPSHLAIRELYEAQLKATQAKLCFWIEANENVEFAVYDQENGNKHFYILAVDWYRDPDYLRDCKIRIETKEYKISLPFGVMLKCVVERGVGAYCHSEQGEVLQVEENFIRVQGVGIQTFTVLKNGKQTAITVDFSDKSMINLEV